MERRLEYKGFFSFMMKLFLGTKITFENEGDEGDEHTIAGDIVFIIRDNHIHYLNVQIRI